MFWTLMIFFHVVAMAFFLGGQIMLAATVVPVLIKDDDPTRVRAVARRFGAGSLIALGVLLLTGLMMASHFQLWDYGPFQVKMGLVVATIISVLVHLTRGQNHALMGITFLLTLATVYAGVNLTH